MKSKIKNCSLNQLPQCPNHITYTPWWHALSQPDFHTLHHCLRQHAFHTPLLHVQETFKSAFERFVINLFFLVFFVQKFKSALSNQLTSLKLQFFKIICNFFCLKLFDSFNDLQFKVISNVFLAIRRHWSNASHVIHLWGSRGDCKRYKHS